jgi:hypothetical protein
VRHHIRTGIDIEAPPAEVWRHLVDLDAYADWNPFIPAASGGVEVGRKLELRLQPPGGRGITIRPTVTAVIPASALEWLGHLVVPGLFDGRHRFDLVPIPSGTHVVHSESFGGLLVRPLHCSLDTDTRAGFEAMNAALRRRAMGTSAPSARPTTR